MKNHLKKDSCCCHDNIDSGAKSGIIYGIIPHSFCIIFIVCSVFGITAGSQLLRPIMLLPYFIPILIGVSLLFASIAAIIYLKKTGNLSKAGVIRKKIYLLTLFGSIIIVNVTFFKYIMPIMGGMETREKVDLLNNVGETCDSGPVCVLSDLQEGSYVGADILMIEVDIPCPGHAFLVREDIEKLPGISDVAFQSPNIFSVTYNPSLIGRDDILKVEIFKNYKAVIK